jgi:hypothetical protein
LARVQVLRNCTATPPALFLLYRTSRN